MKKKMTFMAALLALSCAFAFADFEVGAGVYGGFGSASSVGVGFQVGGMGTSLSPFLWDVVVDGGVGYGFSSSSIDYYVGGLFEAYYAFVGLGVGAGFGNGAAYIRGEAPFLLGPVKLSGGIDYFFNGTYRINFTLFFRGDAALAFMQGLGGGY